ncbi:MAG: hypothetical protein U0610_03450 [bacterium]
MKQSARTIAAVAAAVFLGGRAQAGAPRFDTSWSPSLGTPSATRFGDEAFAVTIDPQGNVYAFYQDHAEDKIACTRYFSNRALDAIDSTSNNTSNNPRGPGKVAKPFVAFAGNRYLYVAGASHDGPGAAAESYWYIMRFTKEPCAPVPWSANAGGLWSSTGARYSVSSNGAALYGVTNGYDEIDGLYVDPDENRITVSGHHGVPNSSYAPGVEGQVGLARFDGRTGLPIWATTYHVSGGGSKGHYDAADGALAIYASGGARYIYVAGRQGGGGIAGVGAKALVLRYTDLGDTPPEAPVAATPWAHPNPFLGPVATAGAVVDATGVYVGGYLANFFGGVPSGSFVLKFDLGLAAQTAAPYLPPEAESRFTRTVAIDNDRGRGYVYVIGAAKSGGSGGDTSLVRLDASSLMKDAAAAPNFCHQSSVACADNTEQTPGGIAKLGDQFYIVGFSTGFPGFTNKKNPLLYSAVGF